MSILARPWDRQPQEKAAATNYPGLKNLWNFGDKSGRCLITGAAIVPPAQPLALTWVTGGLLLKVDSWSTTPAQLPIQIDANAPITLVVGVQHISGTVNVSLMNPMWDGWYLQNGNNWVSTNNTDFSGSVSPTAGSAGHMGITYHAMTFGGANDLRASLGGGPVALDSSCAAPTPSSPNSTIYLGDAVPSAGARSDFVISHLAVIQGAEIGRAHV